MAHKSWSKRHKETFKDAKYNLSNSFAQPLRNQELVTMSFSRTDLEIVDKYHEHKLDGTPNGGSQDLKEEIAKLYGPDISAENVVVFAGAQVAIQTAATVVVGDTKCHSIVFTPGYQSVQEAPLRAGGTVTKLRLRPENRWQIQIDEVEAALRENTKYIVINVPHNPTGTLMKKEPYRQLKELAEKRGIYILSDEAHRLLEHDEEDRLPAMADFYAKGMSCVALSEPWGGCGISIGWIASQDSELKERLLDAQYFGTPCLPRASELQAIMVLRAGDEILKKNMKIIRKNKKLVEKILDDYGEIIEWVPPDAGAIGFVKFKGPLTSEELGYELSEERISIKPSYAFANDLIEGGRRDYDDYFRIGYGEEDAVKALVAFAKFIEKRKHAWVASEE